PFRASALKQLASTMPANVRANTAIDASRDLCRRRHGVPECDHAKLRMPRIASENAERSSIQHETLPCDDGEPEPPCGQHAGNVAMREQRHIAIKLLKTANQPVRSRRNVVR